MLIERLWRTQVGQLYLDILEYQKMEGFCASATIRNILKSFHVPDLILPTVIYGSSSISKLSSTLNATLCNSNREFITSRIVYGNEGYDSFLTALKLVNNPKYRICINFLRSSLFGWKNPYFFFFPHNLFFTLLGGHFSPLVGYFEELDLVAVFDVNHNYGLYFVDTYRLYEAVCTFDFSTKLYRGLVVSEVV